MDQHTHNYIKQLLNKSTRIEIVSGEGDAPGTVTRFHGAKTIRALRRRLTIERCNRDHWSRVEIDGLRCDEI